MREAREQLGNSGAGEGTAPRRSVAVDPVDGTGTEGLRAQILDLQTQLDRAQEMLVAGVHAEEKLLAQLTSQAAHLERVHQEHEELKEELQSRVAPLVDCVAPAGSTAEPSLGAVIAAERTERAKCATCGAPALGVGEKHAVLLPTRDRAPFYYEDE